MAEISKSQFWVVIGSLWAAILVCVGLCVLILVKMNVPASPVMPGVSLASLVTDKAAAAHVAALYEAFSVAAMDPALKSTGQFRASQQVAVGLMKRMNNVPDQPQLNDPISQRIEAAVGLEDVTLDDQKRIALATVLKGIAQELK